MAKKSEYKLEAFALKKHYYMHQNIKEEGILRICEEKRLKILHVPAQENGNHILVLVRSFGLKAISQCSQIREN